MVSIGPSLSNFCCNNNSLQCCHALWKKPPTPALHPRPLHASRPTPPPFQPPHTTSFFSSLPHAAYVCEPFIDMSHPCITLTAHPTAPSLPPAPLPFPVQAQYSRPSRAPLPDFRLPLLYTPPPTHTRTTLLSPASLPFLNQAKKSHSCTPPLPLVPASPIFNPPAPHTHHPHFLPVSALPHRAQNSRLPTAPPPPKPAPFRSFPQLAPMFATTVTRCPNPLSPPCPWLTLPHLCICLKISPLHLESPPRHMWVRVIQDAHPPYTTTPQFSCPASVHSSSPGPLRAPP